MTPEQARHLGELHGKFRQADSKLAEWPGLTDEQVTKAAEEWLRARKAFHREVKALGKDLD